MHPVNTAATPQLYEGPLDGALGQLMRRIVACRACPRLVAHRELVAQKKRAAYRDDDYWGAPVPSHGDAQGRVLFVGLAPAAHGANRTGRLFTGDRSSDFLAAALHRAGFASQPTSRHRADGLTLIDAYLTTVVRCVPPQDRSTPAEQRTCRPYLVEELGLLPNARAVVALGRVAFDGYLRAISERAGARHRHEFRHGARYDLGPGLPALFAAYHPSPRNVNTGRLSAASLDGLLADVRAWVQA